jgi:hypothetical protein
MDLESQHICIETSYVTPYEQMCLIEFQEALMKVGSLISMLENKKLNTINLFLHLIKSKVYQQIFVEMTASSNFKQALGEMISLYPSLAKSKITKLALKKFNT